ncbi:ty3-gypsy retrotransposon protein [Cucumis melo var. makuwa]|uniref:Ty3-gypsy retrotransposon protein n=1 Tax=Cucumis melo var. makuwa TaxID=1194695 RepID=A0A5A7U7P4_CUCMM|nr:ty3-gypsy retrotransposon protein [Cucumis melo var. makuwa]
MTSQSNTSKALSNISKRPNTRSRSREIKSSEDMPPFEVAKNIWEQISKPPKGGIVIKENSAIDEHNSLSDRSNEKVPHPNIMPVMVTDVDTSEDRMAELEKKVNMLMKAVEERDFNIASLKNHIKSRDAAKSNRLEQLLENQLIQLSECKRLKQVGKIDDPNYCKYHQTIGHPVEKCFVLNELILNLAHEKKIELDTNEVAQTNHVEVEMTSSVPSSTQFYDQRKNSIQFATSKPIVVQFQQMIVTIDSQNKEAHGKDDGEGWITLTR